MRAFSSRTHFFAVVCLLGSGCTMLRAQDAPRPGSTLVDRCIRWLKAIEPNQDPSRLDPTSFCRGYRTGNVDGYWLSCNPAQERGGAADHCGFMGRVMPGDTLALSVITLSRDGHEFLDPDVEAGSDRRGMNATLYSRTDFVIDGTRLAAGLYRLSSYKSDEIWEMTFARIDGEWNDPGSAKQIVFRAGMRSNDDGSATDKLIDQMWLFSKHCGDSSRVSSLREFEFSFGTTDVSLCMNVIQALPLAGSGLGDSDSGK